MAKHTYIFKVASRLSLSNLASKLEEHGDILSMREDLGNDTTYTPVLKKPRAQESEEAKRKKSETRIRMVEEKKNEVYLVLAPILKSNPHAPLSRIVTELNRTTDIRNERKTEWNETNIQPYLTDTLERMTKPDET